MIVFLTLCYVALVFVLVKVKVLPNSLPVRISPIAFMILLLVFRYSGVRRQVRPLYCATPFRSFQMYRGRSRTFRFKPTFP